MTTVVNIYKSKYDVYIGRAGKNQDGYFGNPFKLVNESLRDDCVNQYRKWFINRIETDIVFKSRILELKNKTLGCFCNPKACHGDVIAEYLNG